MRLGREWNEIEERRSRHLHCGKHTAGEWVTCCGNINPDHSVCLSRSEIAVAKCSVFPPFQKCFFYVGIFCWIKQRFWVRWFFSVSVLMTQIVWETISFAKYLPTLSRFHEFCWPSERKVTWQLMDFSGVSTKGLWFQTIRQVLRLLRGASQQFIYYFWASVY